MSARERSRPCKQHRSYPATSCPLCDQQIKAIVDRMAAR